MHGQQQRAVSELGDRHQVFERIVAGVAQVGDDDDTERDRGQESVTIGGCFHGSLDANSTRRSTLVVDHELLAKRASRSAKGRIALSVEPPGAKLTMMRTVLLGQSAAPWAQACVVPNRSNAAEPVAESTSRREIDGMYSSQKSVRAFFGCEDKLP